MGAGISEMYFPRVKSQRNQRNVRAEGEKIQRERMEMQHFRYGGNAWIVYDEPLIGESSFSSDFSCVLPKGDNLKSYIEKYFGQRKNLTGIELGGPGIQLFEGFEENQFDRTLAITLTLPPYESSRENHTIYPGDLEAEFTHDFTDMWLRGKNVDFLVERMGSGLDCLTPDPYILSEQFNRWYRRMSDESTMFVQVHPTLVPLMPAFMELLKPSIETGSLEIQLGKQVYSDSLTWYFMRLNKHEGAPNNLPLLNPRMVRGVYELFKADPQIAEGYFTTNPSIK